MNSGFLKDFAPVAILNAIIFAAFGALSAKQSLSVEQTMSASVLIYSSPLQIFLVENRHDGLLLVPIVLALNARFALMSATLMPFIASPLRTTPKIYLHFIVPSVFTLCLTNFRLGHANPVNYFKQVGLGLFMICALSTLLGYYASTKLTGDAHGPWVSLSVSLLLVALNAKLWPRKLDVITFWFGLISMPFFLLLFGNFALIVLPFVLGFFFMIWNRRHTQRTTT